MDNPPFSILAQIVRWYQERSVPFFLFAPALTLFSARNVKGITYLCAHVGITYENGAIVRTSFITNLDTCLVRTAPELYQRVKRANEENQKAGRVSLPKYIYPDHIITAAMVGRWSQYGIEYRLQPEDALRVGELDAQKAHRKAIFGGGFLLSDRAAAERAAAERAAAERAAAHPWELSEREREIVRKLGKAGERNSE